MSICDEISESSMRTIKKRKGKRIEDVQVGERWVRTIRGAGQEKIPATAKPDRGKVRKGGRIELQRSQLEICSDYVIREIYRENRITGVGGG